MANESYNMNKDYIITTDDYNTNHIEEENTNLQIWGTWEELLLACAVKRHGFSDWDSVATELRSRTCFVVSANNCEIKYRDLKLRFHESEMVGNIRSLRVEELRREVKRHDVSILSLELKVKKLEEERKEKPDLRKKGERLENTSMNESNSTTSGEKIGDEPSQTRDDSDDNNNYLDTDPTVEEGSKTSHSCELDESGTSGRKRRRVIRSATSKSQPLISLLDRIRSHPRGSLFERRLRSQETQDYKSLVKQHLGIETIHRKLKQGSYDSSSSVFFYRDLQLLFTNAIVFFPSSSSESLAAHELRTVVSEEMRKETGKSSPKLINWRISKEDYETMAAPLVVCKKRKFISPSSSSLSQKEEMKEEILSEEKDNIVIGVRSSRRANKGENRGKQKESKTKENNSKTTEKETVSSKNKKSVNEFLKRLKNSPQKEGKDQNKSDGSRKSKAKPRELRSNSEGKKVENTPVKRAPGRPQKKIEEAGAMLTRTALGKRGKGKPKHGKGH